LEVVTALTDSIYFPVDSLSGSTLLVRKRGPMSWEILWKGQPVAFVRFKSNYKQIVETSLGRYHLKRKGLFASGRYVLIDVESGNELADGKLFDKNMQLSLAIRGSGNDYVLKWVSFRRQWMIDVVDELGVPIMRLKDLGGKMSWEAEIELEFSKNQSTEVHMLLATGISYWMQDRADRAGSMSIG